MSRPSASFESSAVLRELIQLKRQQGQWAEALILARMGTQTVQALQRESIKAAPHEVSQVSRLALRRYLELMPEDSQARQQLALLELRAPKPIPPRHRHLWLWGLLGLAGLVGLVSAASLHFNLNHWQSQRPLLSLERLAFVPVVNALVHPIGPMSSVMPGTQPVTPLQLPASSTSQIQDKPSQQNNAPIVIRAVGDVVLGSDYPEHRLPTANDQQRMAALRLELRQADLVVGNLEGVLSDKGTSRKDAFKAGFFTFRMPTSYAATLREMGFDVLSLANNHSMDFGTQGLESTLSALRASGITPIGVPGAESALLKIRNTTVAFLNYSYLPAFALLSDEQRLRSDIQQARSAADLVIVSVHGGKEGTSAIGLPQGDEYFMHEYRGDLRKFAHLAIDAGASTVLGHGPHVVRPYETYRDKPIFYSLGNFVGYRSLSTQGKLAHSIVAEVRLSPQGQLLGAGVIPLKLDRSGIPAVDYSADSLQNLSGLLLDKLEQQRPVLALSLSARQASAP